MMQISLKNIGWSLLVMYLTCVIYSTIAICSVIRSKDKQIEEIESNFKALKLTDYEKLQVIDRNYKKIIDNRLKLHGVAKYKLFDEKLSLPLESNDIIITSEYGNRLLNGRWQFHHGIDFLTLFNLNVYSSSSGIVKDIFYNSIYGLTIQIESDKYVITYSHLEMVEVKKGQVVSKSDLIGIVGETGETTGLHLHYAIQEKINGELYSVNPFRVSTYRKVMDVTKHKNMY
jgi:murein DD-endopeptidase MepM/ murein hydrolase activator NlpD